MGYRLCVGTLGIGLVASLLVLAPACAGSGAAPSPASSPVAVTTANASATAASAPIAEPSPTATSSTLVVGNTGGDGAFIRRTPGGDTIRAWPDGAEMVVVGEDGQAEGGTWKNVRDPDGNEGWVATEYLVER